MSRGSFACALALIAALAPIPARAAWPPNGLGIAAATGQQSLLAIVTDGHGGAIVAWRDLATNAYRALRVTGAGEIPPEMVGGGRFAAGLRHPDRARRRRRWRLPGVEGFHLTRARSASRPGRPSTVGAPPASSGEPRRRAFRAGGDRTTGRGGLIASPGPASATPHLPCRPTTSSSAASTRSASTPRGLRRGRRTASRVGADSADQSRPRIVGDDRGGAIVIWDSAPTISDPRATSTPSASAPDGLRRWATNGVPIGAIPDGLLIPDARSGAIVVWSERRAATDDVFAQRVDSTGVTQWGPAGSPVVRGRGRPGCRDRGPGRVRRRDRGVAGRALRRLRHLRQPAVRER